MASRNEVREVVCDSLGKFTLDDMGRLRRFLVLGAEGATYRPRNEAPGLGSAMALQRLITVGRGVECVEAIVEYGSEGRCAKTDQLLFALAMCARFGDARVRTRVFEALPRVCGTPTMLFAFLEFSKALRAGAGADGGAGPRGWGRMQRRGVAGWYNGQDALRLAQGITKYRNRKGWRHRDVLRLCHATPASAAHAECFVHAVGAKAAVAEGKPDAVAAAAGRKQPAEAALSAEDVAKREAVRAYLAAADAAIHCGAGDEARMVELIRAHRLAREHCPTELLGSKAVWQALLQDMPLMAMMRNLNKMTSIGLFEGGECACTALVVSRLSDDALLQRARIHPFNVLLALRTYSSGRGDKGSLVWAPVRAIEDALDGAFYKCFKFLVPTGKRIMLCMDVSGSMDSPCMESSLSAREASSALAMAFLRTEPDCRLMGFCHSLVPLDFVEKNMRLDDVLSFTRDLPFGRTDCSLPMTWARENGIAVDAFVVFTDSETNCNKVSPAQALRSYRAATGINARLVVAATAATQFTVADPGDAGMLDVAGLDSAMPAIISDFIRGEL